MPLYPKVCGSNPGRTLFFLSMYEIEFFLENLIGRTVCRLLFFRLSCHIGEFSCAVSKFPRGFKCF